MTKQVIGIDISKAKFDIAIYDGDSYTMAEFVNDKKGFRAFAKWARKKCGGESVHVCLEATGRYGDGLAQYLHQRGFPVSVVNPAQIKAHRGSQLRRNKTDREDARVIAHFCATNKLRLWTPPPAHIQELQALTRRLNALKDARAAEKNRRQSGELPKTVFKSIKRHIKHLDSQIKEIHELIHDLIDKHPDLKEKKELLVSIPSIGDVTAAEFIAEVPDVRQFDSASQLAAFAGLTPSQYQSGTSSRPGRMSKMGNKRLRRMFFMPALTAIRWNPISIRLVDRLTQRGKSKPTIIGAIMRQLIHIAYGVLKNSKPFDPNFGNLQTAA